MLSPIFKELVPVDVNLNSIFLDPNNPRFVDFKWDYVKREEIEPKQKEVQEKLIAGFAVEKLASNIEVNGFLPIDRVIIQEIDGENSKYVVLEGNRRICAAKIVAQKLEKSTDATNVEIKTSLANIPCLLYTGTNSKAAWIFQGLRHISGIMDWPAFNKAKLLVTMVSDEGLTLSDVGSRFGLSPYGAGQWMRAFYAYSQSKESSDYVDEVDEKAFPYFQELFNRSTAALREWLVWDDTTKKFVDEIRFNEYLGWLYPRPEDGEELISSKRGEWNARKIERSIDLRKLSALIKEDKAAFEIFRRDLELERAYTQSLQKKYAEEEKRSINVTTEIFESIDRCNDLLENIPHKIMTDSDLRTRLNQMIAKLETTISSLGIK